MARNYAALPWDYDREMDALNDAEFGRLCRALIRYSQSGTPIALSGNERFYANRVMDQEDKFKASYQTRVQNGGNGGRPKKTEENQTEPNETEENQEKPNLTEIANNKTKTKTKTISANADIRVQSNDCTCQTAAQSDVLAAVEAWNSLGLNRVTTVKKTSTRYKLLSARLKDYGLDGWMTAIEEIKKSKWLQGGGSKGWVITFDWLVRPNNFPKVHDGNYRDKNPNPTYGTAADQLRQAYEFFAEEERAT